MRKQIQKICEILKNNTFLSLGTVKPDIVEKNNIIYLTNKKNKEKMKKKIKEISQIKIEKQENNNLISNNNIDNINNKENDLLSNDLNIDYKSNIIDNTIINNNLINAYEISEYIEKKDIYQFYKNLSNKANEQEKNLVKLIEGLDEFNNIFDICVEKALKDSIFEYKIEHIFLVDKETKQYLEEKNKCSNREEKILFHGTKINSAIDILSGHFLDAKNHLIGKGVYFTDMLDYAWFYSGENKKNFSNIPKVGEFFTIVASEIYYDKTKLEEVYDTSTEESRVPKFGIRCCYADYVGSKLDKDELNNSNGVIWKEYLITEKTQILPLYCITMKRIEYLVIWRDYNFNSKNPNPNNYSKKIFDAIKTFHKNIKRAIVTELGSKIYFVNTTEEALELIEIKKYNKIIIITNGYNDAEKFINKARKIIGANSIVGVSVYDIEKHYSWIKNMENTILLNGIDYHLKFFKSIINNNIKDLYDLRKEIIRDYRKTVGDFNLREFNDYLLNFPNFKAQGNFGELTIKKKKEKESCQII